MIRVLNLRTNCLSQPTRTDLIVIECTMLYPHPEHQLDARTAAALAARVAAGLEVGELMSKEELLELTRLAATAMPIDKIREQVAVRNGGPFVKGCIAGDILTLAIDRNASNSRDA